MAIKAFVRIVGWNKELTGGSWWRTQHAVTEARDVPDLFYQTHGGVSETSEDGMCAFAVTRRRGTHSNGNFNPSPAWGWDGVLAVARGRQVQVVGFNVPMPEFERRLSAGQRACLNWARACARHEGTCTSFGHPMWKEIMVK